MKHSIKKCVLCDRWTDGRIILHRIKEHMIKDLQKLHVHPRKKLIIKKSTRVCCHHFEDHIHNGAHTKLIVKSEFTLPEVLASTNVICNKKSKRKRVSKLQKLVKTVKEERKKVEQATSDTPERTLRSSFLDTDCGLVEKILHTKSLLELNELKQECLKNKDESDLSKSLLHFMSLHEKNEENRTLIPLNMFGNRRLEFILETGVTPEILEMYFVNPLQKYYLAQGKKDNRYLPVFDCSVSGRVMWLFMWMFNDYSFSSLKGKLEYTKTYLRSTSNIVSLINRTALDLRKALMASEYAIQFPSIDEWQERNTGAGE